MGPDPLLDFWIGGACAAPAALAARQSLRLGRDQNGPGDVARRDALLAARFGQG